MRTIPAWIDGGSSSPEASLTIGEQADGDTSFVEITVAANGRPVTVLLDAESLRCLMAEAGHHLRTM